MMYRNEKLENAEKKFAFKNNTVFTDTSNVKIDSKEKEGTEEINKNIGSLKVLHEMKYHK